MASTPQTFAPNQNTLPKTIPTIETSKWYFFAVLTLTVFAWVSPQYLSDNSGVFSCKLHLFLRVCSDWTSVAELQSKCSWNTVTVAIFSSLPVLALYRRASCTKLPNFTLLYWPALALTFYSYVYFLYAGTCLSWSCILLWIAVHEHTVCMPAFLLCILP